MNDNAVEMFYHLYFGSEDSLTTTELAKRVFQPDGREETRNADRKIRYYVEDSYSHLVNVESEGGTKHISLADESLWFGRGKLHVVTPMAEEVITGFGDVLVYLDGEGDPNVVSVEPDEGFDPDDLPASEAA